MLSKKRKHSLDMLVRTMRLKRRSNIQRMPRAHRVNGKYASDWQLTVIRLVWVVGRWLSLLLLWSLLCSIGCGKIPVVYTFLVVAIQASESLENRTCRRHGSNFLWATCLSLFSSPTPLLHSNNNHGHFHDCCRWLLFHERTRVEAQGDGIGFARLCPCLRFGVGQDARCCQSPGVSR